MIQVSAVARGASSMAFLFFLLVVAAAAVIYAVVRHDADTNPAMLVAAVAVLLVLVSLVGGVPTTPDGSDA
jgi:uncharacterized protein involved in response to NO